MLQDSHLQVTNNGSFTYLGQHSPQGPEISATHAEIYPMRVSKQAFLVDSYKYITPFKQV